MEGQRPYPYGIILAGVIFLALGFGLGFFGTKQVLYKHSKPRLQIGANNIMAKRMRAINQALQQGKKEYEFEVTGFHPLLSK